MKRLPLFLALVTLPAFAAETATPFASVEVAPGIYAIGNTNEGFALNIPEDFVGGNAGLLVGDEYSWFFITTDVMTKTLIRSLTGN